MKRLIIIATLMIICMSLPVVVWADWVPSDFKQWQNTDSTDQYRLRIGGAMCHYQDTDTSWVAIDNDWHISGDTMAYNIKDLLKTGVMLDGTSKVSLTWEGNEYILTQIPRKFVWINTDTWSWTDVTESANWTIPSVDSNIIHWANVWPGVDYRIRKLNSSVQHGVFFKPAFLDSAVVLYNQRSDSLDIALGNVFEYTLSSNIDHADSALGSMSRRRLKNIGKYAFELTDQRVHFPGSDTLRPLPVKQRWVKQGGKIYCVEYIMMSRIKQIHAAYPSATIWHNDEIKVIDGTTNVEDAQIRPAALADYNTGATITLGTSASFKTLVRVKNVATEIGVEATISAAVCSLYCTTLGGTQTYGAYSVFKPWEEGTQDFAICANPGCSYNDWDCTTKEWATAGCGSADDGGSDNSGDGTGADRKATAEDTETVGAVNTWFGWGISAELAQAWYAGTKNEEGVLIEYVSGGGGNNYYASTEGVSNQPFWTFTYTVGGEPEPNRRKQVIKLLGKK